MDPYSADTILYFRAIQGHSGRKHIKPTLQDNVLLPSDLIEHIYHVGSSHDMHSIIPSGLIPGGKDVKKGRHAVFFTAVNPMNIVHYREKDYDMTQLETAPKHSVLVQFEGCWEERIAVLSNTIKRDHPSQRFTCDVHRESGIHEVKRRIVQQNVSVSYCTAENCSEAELES